MVEVRITGWRDGLDKIAMTMAIQEHTKHDLAAANACTDAVLEGNEVVLWVKDGETAQALAAKLEECGAMAGVGDDH